MPIKCRLNRIPAELIIIAKHQWVKLVGDVYVYIFYLPEVILILIAAKRSTLIDRTREPRQFWEILCY